jgi:hypothetical protein
MKRRCRDSKCPSHGGRGITYDPRWESFDDFLLDMGPRPSEELTLDRVNPNYHYCKGNCIWGTDGQQARHKRNTETLWYGGRPGSPAEWSRYLRKITGSEFWSARQLRLVLKAGLSLSQLIGAFHPFRLTPEELNERAREAQITAEDRRVNALLDSLAREEVPCVDRYS